LQCAQNQENCSLSQSTSSEDTLHHHKYTPLERIASLSAKLAKSPMIVPHSKFGSGFLDATSLQRVLSSHLYWPASWKILVDKLAAAEGGNGTLLFEATHGSFKPHRDSSEHPPAKKTRHSYGASTTINVIQCVDSKALSPKYRDRDVQISAIRELGGQSPIGELWARYALRLNLGCI